MHASSSFATRKRSPPSLLFPMHTGIIFIGVLSLICWCVQLLPVISVPLTGKGTNYNLNLSNYNNITFGVFGVCDTVSGVCSRPKIGYSSDDLVYYHTGLFSDLPSVTEVQLPSDVTHLISKLLVLHVVAFGFTCLLLLQSISIIVSSLLEQQTPPFSHIRGAFHKLRSKIPPSNDSISHSEKTLVESSGTPRQHNYTQLTLMFLFAVLSFLLSLLAFLADFVLFVPKLSPLGWIQMLPVLVMAIIASLSCFLKRSIQSRRHLEDAAFFSDGMRAKHSVLVEWDDDLRSDDGVFIYSNGFSSENKDDEPRRSILLASTYPNPQHSINTEMHSLASETHLRMA